MGSIQNLFVSRLLKIYYNLIIIITLLVQYDFILHSDHFRVFREIKFMISQRFGKMCYLNGVLDVM